jgi:hypothetical protein
LAGGFAEPVERPNELDLEIVPNARESTLVRNVAATQTRALQLGHDDRRALGRHDHVASTSRDGVDDRVGEGDLEPRGADDDVSRTLARTSAASADSPQRSAADGRCNQGTQRSAVSHRGSRGR